MSDMGDALAHCHRSEEAIALLNNAMRLNPFYPDQYLWHLGGAYFNLKRYDEAIQTLHGMQNPTEGRRLLAASYGHLGRIEEARAEAAKVLQAHPDFSVERWAAVQPDKDSTDVAHFVEGLHKAGL
jgi:tetratricopeptide (TPR) repeat protein